MKHPDFKFYLAVFSHGRPQSVPEVTSNLGLGCEATWYVGEGEAKAYRKAGAKRVVGSGNLPVSRNVALDDAWQQGCTCVQLSDDLRRFSMASARTENLKVLTAALIVIASIDACGGVYLGSGNSTSNPYMAIGLRTGNKLPPHVRPLISTSSLILGDFSVVKPCGIYFDESTLVKEDYEYTLRHLKAFGKVIRCNYLLMDFRHRTNPGGANLYRFGKSKAEVSAYNYLLERWPGVIRKRIKTGPTSSQYELQISWRPDKTAALPEVHPRFVR